MSFFLSPLVSTLLEAGSSIATGPGVGFWTVLFDAGLSHKCLLAIIFALLDRDKPVRAHTQHYMVILSLEY